MRMKFFRGLVLFGLLLMLSGCSGADGLIESVEGLVKSIDELVQSETAKEKEEGSTEKSEVKNEEPVTTSEASVESDEESIGEDPTTMFGEEDEVGSVSPDFFLQVSPYYHLYEGNIDPPNGYFLPLYDDWLLVSVIEDGANNTWKGKFCYDSDPYYTASQYFADIEGLGLTITSSWFEDDGQETADGFDHRRFAYYYGADYEGIIDGLNINLIGSIQFFTDSRGEYCNVSTFTVIP